MATTSELLTSLQNDLDRTITALELEEGTNFTDIANMAENGDISTGGGADLSDYFTNTLDYGTSSSPGILKTIRSIPQGVVVSGTSLACAFYNCVNLISVPLIDTSNITNMQNMFRACHALISIPQLDTNLVTNMSWMFGGCWALTTVPQLNTSSVTNFDNMFAGVNVLSNDSLNNILAMCIGATSYTGTKKLTTLGIESIYYSAETIQSLSNYSAFIDAGWTIGY